MISIPMQDRNPEFTLGERGWIMKKLSALDWIVIILVIIGGLNWGLVGFFEFDLVAAIFGDMTMVTRIIYDLIGLAALYKIFTFNQCCQDSKKADKPAE